jgi:hypothetical protein
MKNSESEILSFRKQLEDAELINDKVFDYNKLSKSILY